jgi:pimeloyl-ACP methyl ester carboxylesterase
MAGYTALAIDLLGHGESDRPDDASYALDAQAEYIGRALAVLRLSAVSLIGQDIGALVGLLVAATPRLEVERVCLLSPPDPNDLPGAEIRSLQRLSARVALQSNTLFGAQPALAPLLRAAVSAPEHMPDLLVARYLAPFVGHDGLSQLLQRASAVELSAAGLSRLASVAAAVLVVDGEADPPRPSLSWGAVLPAATVTVRRIAGGRLLGEDAPSALAELIIDWLPGQRNH